MSEYGTWIFVAVLIVGFILMKRRGGIGVEEAKTHLAQGAVAVDVRSNAEFASSHLPKAKNIPLDQLAEQIVDRIPDKHTVLLCHCASGVRSGTAASKLRSMGYTKAYNIGGMHRAAKIIGK